MICTAEASWSLPACFGASAVPVQLPFRWSVVGETQRVWLLTVLGDAISQQTPRSSVSYSLSTLLPQCSLSWSLECFADVPFGARPQSTAVWLVVVFCSGLHLLQREFSLEEG